MQLNITLQNELPETDTQGFASTQQKAASEQATVSLLTPFGPMCSERDFDGMLMTAC